MNDQRKCPRVAISGFVNLKVNALKLQFSGPVELISLKGIGIYTKVKINPGTPVVFQLICFKGAETLDYRFTGIVTNSNRTVAKFSRENEIWVMGIKFDKEVNFGDQLPLYNLLIQDEKKGHDKEACLLS